MHHTDLFLLLYYRNYLLLILKVKTPLLKRHRYYYFYSILYNCRWTSCVLVFFVFASSFSAGTSTGNEPKLGKFLPSSDSFALTAKQKTHYLLWKQRGTLVTVTQSCQKCISGYTWRSQPLVLGKIPAGNVLLSFAVLMAGASISKILLVFRHIAVLG